MSNYKRMFKAFNERDLRSYFAENDAKINSRIENETENYILNVNETEYVDHLYSEFVIADPILDFDAVTVTSYEKLIPAENFPWTFNVYPGKSYPKETIVYWLPFGGDGELFKCVSKPLTETYPTEAGGWDGEGYSVAA